jgi:hypothetical protein
MAIIDNLIKMLIQHDISVKNDKLPKKLHSLGLATVASAVVGCVVGVCLPP